MLALRSLQKSVSSLRHLDKHAIRFTNVNKISTILIRTKSTNVQNDENTPNTDDFAPYYEEIKENASPIRPRLRVKDLLRTMEMKVFEISQDATLKDAISHLNKEKMSSCLAVDSKGSVCGIFTARDILKYVERQVQTNAKATIEYALKSHNVKEIMTTKDKLVYCSPSDTSRRCREVMFLSKIRNLPILENNEVKGIITMKQLADASFNLNDIGGKKGFIKNVTGRKGLPDGTKINGNIIKQRKIQHGDHSMDTVEDKNILPHHFNMTSSALMLDMEIGSFSLPHPFKRPQGVAMNRRLYGADELSRDPSLIEDAHFALKISDALASNPNKKRATDRHDPALVYLCVADGVGSWRQYGVDPREYSHKLVENAQKVIESDLTHRELIRHSPFDRDLDPVHPLDVIMDAWNMTTSDAVVGSSTICVATLDKKLNQLSYSNLGDCGLMLVRHIDSETAGYMRERQLPRHLRKTDWRLAYLSQQQLRGFNLPYQLGYTNIPDTPNSFETPVDADTASIPVMVGDVIILATDGLFDNLDLDEIIQEVSKWEKDWFEADISFGLQNDKVGKGSPEEALAKQLVERARELSLIQDRDSPFAVLAKENDIMYGGGMPDDTTVVVARVIASAQ